MFGIVNADGLREEIRMLEEFQPRLCRAGDLPAGVASEKFEGMLKGAVWKIQASCKKETQDESAWTHSHILYLAGLGVTAGFLAPEEGERLAQNASKVVSGRFSSWPGFTRSFVLGAELHNGWEAERYKNICNRILEAGIPWP